MPGFRSLLLAALCVSLVGCASLPEVYAPPAQRKPLEREILARTQPLLDMGDPAVERYIVADIAKGAQPAPWRWTGKRPTIKFPLKSASNYRLKAELAVPDVTFQETGPVTITFFVNDQLFDKVRYDTPGQKTYEKPVPIYLLKPMSENTLAAEIDKIYTSKNDGTKLGFILARFGLEQ